MDFSVQGNRYRRKCPSRLSLSDTPSSSPYQRPVHTRLPETPLSKLSYQIQTQGQYVPTPPCPAPGTRCNTFTYDHYSTSVWASEVYQQQKLSFQFQSALLQRQLLNEVHLPAQPPGVSYSSTASCSPEDVIATLALTLLQEDVEAGALYPSYISRVSSDGDICDDVLDYNTPDTSADDLRASSTRPDDSVAVPPSDSPSVYSVPATPTAVSIVIKAEVTASTTARVTSSAGSASRKKPGRHQCSECPKVFNWRTGLVTHMRVHTGERPYQCADCSKSFNDYSTYTKHCRIHSGLKPYACDVCKKTFIQSGNKHRHMRTIHKASV